MDKIRWGILATGSIAGALAYAINETEDAELLAVGSRTQGSADAFGDERSVPRRYASYAALCADPDVDVIYIATPHNLHAENMRTALENGKHVLCEKPLTLNAAEAEAAINLARANNLFLMEAVWMRFIPAIRQVKQWVVEGKIGQVRLLEADFCFNLPYDPQHRLYNPQLGGGALLDLGIYNLSLTTLLLGFPDQIHGHAHIGETGVDELDTFLLNWQNGASALLSCSMRINRPKEAMIIGTEGYIKIHDVFFRPDTLTLHVDGQEPEVVSIPYRSNGYIHEVEEVHRCLRAGELESPLMPLDETLRMLRLMDELRQIWGVVYPQEQAS